MKRDIFNHKQRYENWKSEVSELGIDSLTKKNSDLLIQYVFDMELGVNVSRLSKKGARSYIRLNNIRQRLSQIIKMLQDRRISDITKVTQNQITLFFNDMSKGVIKTQKGETYRSIEDYENVFKSFWHWWMKINRKKDITLFDITEDLEKPKRNPRFVYLTKEQLDEMLPYFNDSEQVLLLFVFDSIIRSPTELLSLQVKDIYKKEGIVWVNIPDEISKTFGRTFNLLYCGDALWGYIQKNDLKPDDFLFTLSHFMLTKKMQKVANQLWGNKLSHPKAGEQFNKITLYDLRHSGAIHLRVLASKTGKVSLDALRQRGGWIDLKMINYYTQFIGLDGSIDKDALLIEEDKSKLERDVDKLKQLGKTNNVRIAKLFKLLEVPEVRKLLAKNHPKEVMGLLD